MNTSVHLKLFAALLFILTGIGVTGYIVYQNNLQFQASSECAEHGRQVIDQSNNILLLAEDLESASNDFAISGDSSLLSPSLFSDESVFPPVAQLRQLVAGIPSQQARIDSLNYYMRKRLDFSRNTIHLRSTIGPEAAYAYIATQRGKAYTGHIRQIINSIQDEENALSRKNRQAGSENLATSCQILFNVLGTLAVITLFLFFGVYLFSWRRYKRERELAGANAGLNKETREAYNNAPCGYLTVDSNKIICEVNGMLLDWLAYGINEIGGKLKFEDILAPESREIYLRDAESIFSRDYEKETKDGAEYLLQRKDGTTFPVQVNFNPVCDSNGDFLKCRLTVLDISWRKALEEQLEMANKETDAFAHAIAHDLHAPLRAVLGYTKMLSDDYGVRLDTEANRLINNIAGYGQKMSGLIDNLLALSHLERRELVKTTTRMNLVVSNVWEESRKEYNNHKILFNLKTLPSAPADNSAIRQVWSNLISNALKYSKLKEPAVIEIGSESKRDEVVYYIKDNGAGFDMHYAGKLFHVCNRLHKGEEFAGTGMGLAIVHKIISKHGGKVWAEATKNAGATFYFSLPRKYVNDGFYELR